MENPRRADYVSHPRSLPENIEAEKSVLGSVLISASAAETAIEKLRADDFHLPPHRDIFDAMLSLHNRGKPIDVITLMDALDAAGKLKNAGGATYITELSIYTPSSANVSYYADIVKENSLRRKLIEVGSDISADAQNLEKETRSALNDAERRIFEIAVNKSSNTLRPISGTLYESYRRIGELISLDGALSGITTGFTDLDRLTSGLQRSDLIIIAARPSMGKTSLAMNIAANAALNANATVSVFSLEMSAEQLAMRMICSEACVNMQSIKTGNPTDSDLISVAEAIKSLEKTNIYIDDTSSISVPEIRSKCRRLKAQTGLDMIVIDYLQLMESDKKSESRVQEVSHLTRSLKALARELEVPVILLSQLSRAPENRTSPRPVMSDLRESGAIEQDADVIMLLYRPSYYDKSEDNICEVIVSKHRNGPTDTVKLAWIKDYTKFTNSAEGGYSFND